MKKVIKFFIVCFILLGFIIGMQSQPKLSAEFCEIPPQGEPIPDGCSFTP